MDEMSKTYPKVKIDYFHVDAMCIFLIEAPERFDVIVTTNMFGDIITDLAAVTQGGMGVAPSGNINPRWSEHVRASPWQRAAVYR